MKWKKFLIDTVERMVRGAALSIMAIYSASAFALNAHTNWSAIEWAALSGACGSLLLSIIGATGVLPGSTKGTTSLLS